MTDPYEILGIAKTAREEKTRARDAKLKSTEQIKQDAENARMMALYKEHVLGEKIAPPQEGFIPLGSIGGIKPAVENKEEVMGD